MEHFPTKIIVPVAWGDMDAFGHVNNVMYFRYFESARIKYFEAIDFQHFDINDGIGPILAHTNCQFKKPVTYPDQLTVVVRVKSIGRTSMVMEHIIVSDKLGEAAKGEGVVVCLNYKTGQTVAIPDALRKAIEKHEQKSFD